MPQNIYDDPNFYQNYTQLPRSQQGLPGAPEWVQLQTFLPPLQDLRVLDLGCGFGAFTRYARDHGAQHVLALDLSENMLTEARARTPDLTRITYQRADIETLTLPAGSLDLVYSALVLHYLPNIETLFASLANALVPGGAFVFSIEHPIYTAPTNPRFETAPDGTRVWQLNGYLRPGQRITDWLATGVVKYHRTTATYLNALIHNDFQLAHLADWGPSPEQIAEHPEWAEELERPFFLLAAARRSALS